MSPGDMGGYAPGEMWIPMAAIFNKWTQFHWYTHYEPIFRITVTPAHIARYLKFENLRFGEIF